MCVEWGYFAPSPSRSLSTARNTYLGKRFHMLAEGYPQFTGVKTETDLKFSSSQSSLQGEPLRSQVPASVDREPGKGGLPPDTASLDRLTCKLGPPEDATGESRKKRSWGLRVHNHVDDGWGATVVKHSPVDPAAHPLRRSRRSAHVPVGLRCAIPNPQALRRRRGLKDHSPSQHLRVLWRTGRLGVCARTSAWFRQTGAKNSARRR
jgi:hypothetical protein